MQSRLGSFIEAVTNTAIGWSIMARRVELVEERG